MNAEEEQTEIVSAIGTCPDVESQPTSQILPFLYLGNGRDADDPVTLDRLGISRVLNVTSDLPCGKNLRSRGILYKQLPAVDSGHQNLRQYFDDAYQFIGKLTRLIILFITSFKKAGTGKGALLVVD